MSSEERRYVAERLRKHAGWLVLLGEPIGEDELDGNCENAGLGADYLAGLIDPTCHVESSMFDDTCECESPAWGYRLSCGHWVDWGDSEPPSYCPYCGARIIRWRDFGGI
ncbi:MAG: hypothetical protein LKG38_06080 [Atopobiaceae bacterium]|jgi:hypothetical protein|nr:hypothetical protein [Atopobiaceae bacterium]